jgi:hypothetical protein
MIRRLGAVALLVLAASCGHKDAQSTSSSSTTTVQTPSAAAPVNAVTTGVPAVGAGNGASTNGNPPGFSDEASAKAHCATDEVVWLNMTSKIYHLKGTHFYGTTKHGEYACRKEADAAGDRNSKS